MRARERSNSALTRPSNSEEEIAAWTKHVERMKQSETKIEKLFRSGTRGGEAKEYATAKRERESAEIGLLRARIKIRK